MGKLNRHQKPTDSSYRAKMYKSGRNWVVAGATMLSFALGMTVMSTTSHVTAHADSTPASDETTDASATPSSTAVLQSSVSSTSETATTGESSTIQTASTTADTTSEARSDTGTTTPASDSSATTQTTEKTTTTDNSETKTTDAATTDSASTAKTAASTSEATTSDQNNVTGTTTEKAATSNAASSETTTTDTANTGDNANTTTALPANDTTTAATTGSTDTNATTTDLSANDVNVTNLGATTADTMASAKQALAAVYLKTGVGQTLTGELADSEVLFVTTTDGNGAYSLDPNATSNLNITINPENADQYLTAKNGTGATLTINGATVQLTNGHEPGDDNAGYPAGVAMLASNQQIDFTSDFSLSVTVNVDYDPTMGDGWVGGDGMAIVFEQVPLNTAFTSMQTGSGMGISGEAGNVLGYIVSSNALGYSPVGYPGGNWIIYQVNSAYTGDAGDDPLETHIPVALQSGETAKSLSYTLNASYDAETQTLQTSVVDSTGQLLKEWTTAIPDSDLNQLYTLGITGSTAASQAAYTATVNSYSYTAKTVNLDITSTGLPTDITQSDVLGMPNDVVAFYQAGTTAPTVDGDGNAVTNAIAVQDIDGYHLSGPAFVDLNAADNSVNLDFVSSGTITYVDDTDPSVDLSTYNQQTPEGGYGDTVAWTADAPAGYVLADNQAATGDYTIGSSDDVVVHVVEATPLTINYVYNDGTVVSYTNTDDVDANGNPTESTASVVTAAEGSLMYVTSGADFLNQADLTNSFDTSLYDFTDAQKADIEALMAKVADQMTTNIPSGGAYVLSYAGKYYLVDPSQYTTTDGTTTAFDPTAAQNGVLDVTLDTITATEAKPVTLVTTYSGAGSQIPADQVANYDAGYTADLSDPSQNSTDQLRKAFNLIPDGVTTMITPTVPGYTADKASTFDDYVATLQALANGDTNALNDLMTVTLSYQGVTTDANGDYWYNGVDLTALTNQMNSGELTGTDLANAAYTIIMSPIYQDILLGGTLTAHVTYTADPSNPTGPTDPTGPTNPTGPTDPTNPTNPTDPTNPTTPGDGDTDTSTSGDTGSSNDGQGDVETGKDADTVGGNSGSSTGTNGTSQSGTGNGQVMTTAANALVNATGTTANAAGVTGQVNGNTANSTTGTDKNKLPQTNDDTQNAWTVAGLSLLGLMGLLGLADRKKRRN